MGYIEVSLTEKYGKMNRLVLFDRQFNQDKLTNSAG